MTPTDLRRWLLARAERQALDGPFDLGLSMALDRALVAAEAADAQQHELDVHRLLSGLEERVA